MRFWFVVFCNVAAAICLLSACCCHKGAAVMEILLVTTTVVIVFVVPVNANLQFDGFHCMRVRMVLILFAVVFAMVIIMDFISGI